LNKTIKVPHSCYSLLFLFLDHLKALSFFAHRSLPGLKFLTLASPPNGFLRSVVQPAKNSPWDPWWWSRCSFLIWLIFIQCLSFIGDFCWSVYLNLLALSPLVLFVYAHFGGFWFNSGIDIRAVPGPVCFHFW